MKSFLTLLSILVTSVVFPQSAEVVVFLKNNQTISCNVDEIKPNGFINEEQVLIFFKVTDSIHVTGNNEELVAQFANGIEGEILTYHPGYTTIDLRACTFPAIPPKSGNLFSKTVAGVSVSSFYVTLAGLHLDSEFAARPNMFLRLDFSTGLANKSDVLFSSYQIGLAAGIKLPVFLKPQGFVGFGAFGSSDLIGDEATQYRIYFNGAVEQDVYGIDWLSIMAGVTYYMVPIKYAGKENQINYNLGLNFNLGKF
ncbi:MAG: hypothetical protein LCH54_00455 [Bacteroidetes bacterium]|nr:hypothetical protein [Bacteroidota bacterium]